MGISPVCTHIDNGEVKTVRSAFLCFFLFIFFTVSSSFAGTLIKDGGKNIKLLPKEAHIVYSLSLKEVERQLQEITRTAKFEDLWFWVDSDNKLYDMGVDGTLGQVSSDFCVMKDHPDLFKNKRLVDIHIHPDYSRKGVVSMPSLTDMCSAARYAKDFPRTHNASVVAEVLDGYGVWRYGPGRHINEFASRKDSEISRRFSAANNRYHCARCNIVNVGLTRAERIKRYLNEVRELGIDITYEDLP